MKKLVIFILALIMSVSLSVCFAGCSQSNSSNVDNSSQTEPQPPEPEPIVKIEREDVQTKLVQNVENITLKDVCETFENPYFVVGLLFKDLTLGDVLKSAASDIVCVDYYSDGYWYLSSGAKFDDLSNAIFNYRIASGQPLALTQEQLAESGDNRVIDCFSKLFSINLDKPLSFNDELDYLIEPIVHITIRELYNLTCGDFSGLITDIGNKSIDSLIDVVFGSASYNVAEVLKHFIDGTIAQPYINNNLTFSVVIDDLTKIMASVDFANAEKWKKFGALTEEFYKGNNYDNVTLENFVQYTLNADVDVFINYSVDVINAVFVTDSMAQLKITQTGALLCELFDGTLSQPLFNAQADCEQLLKDLLNGLFKDVAQEQSDRLSELIVNRVNRLIALFTDDNGNCIGLTKLQELINNGLTVNEIDVFGFGLINKLLSYYDIDYSTYSNVKISDILTVINAEYAEFCNNPLACFAKNALPYADFVLAPFKGKTLARLNDDFGGLLTPFITEENKNKVLIGEQSAFRTWIETYIFDPLNDYFANPEGYVGSLKEQFNLFIAENGEKTLAVIDAELFDGLLAGYLPDCLMQLTLNAFLENTQKGYEWAKNAYKYVGRIVSEYLKNPEQFVEQSLLPFVQKLKNETIAQIDSQYFGGVLSSLLGEEIYNAVKDLMFNHIYMYAISLYGNASLKELDQMFFKGAIFGSSKFTENFSMLLPLIEYSLEDYANLLNGLPSDELKKDLDKISFVELYNAIIAFTLPDKVLSVAA